MRVWEGLDEFVTVAETGNFTRAAARLGVSVSQVSRAIGRIEERLGVELFSRNTRRVTLTESGKLFEERCRQLINKREAAFEEVASHKDIMKGRIRLTCSVAYGEQTLMPILGDFLEKFPEISVDVDLTNAVVDLISAGLDLAVRVGGISDPRLGHVKIGSRTLHLCASPGYVSDREPLTPQDLVAHHFILGVSPLWRLNDEGKEIQISPKGRFRCNSGFAVLDLALRGFGICQLPDYYVYPYLEKGLLVEILKEARPVEEPIWAAYPLKDVQSLRVVRLIEFIKQNLDLRQKITC
jgi:DNA-binding transcriptional LysR family regulator